MNGLRRVFVANRGEIAVEGVNTTIAFHREVLRHADFRTSRITTRWVENEFLPAWLRIPGRTAVSLA